MKRRISPIHLKDSIATRLLKVVFSIYVVISICLTAFHMYTEYANTKKAVRQEIEALYNMIHVGLTNAFFDADLFQVRDILSGLTTSPNTLGCRLVDAFGKTVEKSGTILKSEPGTPVRTSDESVYYEDQKSGLFSYDRKIRLDFSNTPYSFYKKIIDWVFVRYMTHQ